MDHDLLHLIQTSSSNVHECISAAIHASVREPVAAAFQQYQTSLLSRSPSPSGPGTFSGPRLTTPYPRGQRFLAPPYRFPVSASHTTGRTCARPRTTTDALLIITPYWCMVSISRVFQLFLQFKRLFVFLHCFHLQLRVSPATVDCSE